MLTTRKFHASVQADISAQVTDSKNSAFMPIPSKTRFSVCDQILVKAISHLIGILPVWIFASATKTYVVFRAAIYPLRPAQGVTWRVPGWFQVARHLLAVSLRYREQSSTVLRSLPPSSKPFKRKKKLLLDVVDLYSDAIAYC